ncbi:MAG: tetratricopeptide repeat protein [Sphingorhabdus sp.]
MPSRNKLIIWGASSALILGAGFGGFTQLHALNGGGGGGGSIGGAPSQSAPRYDASAEYQKGVTFFKAKDYKKAAQAFKRSLSAAPKNANAHYLLGLSYMGLEKYRKARKPLEKAVKYDERLVGAQRDLAITYHRLGQSDKANAALAALETKCGGSCAADSELGKAIATVKSALQDGQASNVLAQDFDFASAPSGDGFYVSAVALINEGKYQKALSQLDDAAKSFGPHPDILTYMGFANRKLQRYDIAEDYYQRALAVAPNHLGALEYYGELKIERGNIAGARQHLARLEKLCSFGCYEADELRRWIEEAPKG